jgi:hypothetical protein
VCTLTCLPEAALGSCEGPPLRLRLVFSRDEQRTRCAGFPPELTTHKRHHVLMPRDGEAGGTWIAANDAGVVFALLNVHRLARSRHRDWQGDRHPDGSRVPVPINGDKGTGTVDGRAVAVRTDRFRTRGAVIAHLTAAISVPDAGARARTLPFAAFRPFRVLAFDIEARFVETLWTGERVRQRLGRLSGPLLRTSSGLGDALVTGPRRRLFTRMMRGGQHPAAAQDAFHRHQWPGRGALSVLMSRAEAGTVSITTVEVGEDRVWMEYLVPQSRALREAPLDDSDRPNGSYAVAGRRAHIFRRRGEATAAAV